MTDDIHVQLYAELADLQAEVVEAQNAEALALLRLSEAWELTSTGTAGCGTRSLAEQLTADGDAIVRALGYDPGESGSLGDVATTAAEAVERLPDAQTALRDYLVSRGLPSDPIRLDDPHLWALCEALL